MKFLASPLFKFLEIGLWGVILYHAFNGIRIVAVDFARGSLHHKKLFWVLIIIAFILCVSGGLIIISHI
jgi:succinate dehydrogenase / fumarate reductase cytochrome b subunit